MYTLERGARARGGVWGRVSAVTGAAEGKGAIRPIARRPFAGRVLCAAARQECGDGARRRPVAVMPCSGCDGVLAARGRGWVVGWLVVVGWWWWWWGDGVMGV